MDAMMVFGAALMAALLLFILALATLVLIAFSRRERSRADYTPRITVVVPAYNEETRIAACLRALLACDYPGKRTLILVDDGSTDRTAERAGRIEGVRVIHRPHAGKVAALNAGLRAATGEVLVTVDADTTVRPDFLQAILRPFSEARVGAVSGPALVAQTRGLLASFQAIEYAYNNLVRTAFSRLFRTDVWFFGCLAAYRIDALKAVGGFSDSTMTEDMDVVTRLRRKGFATIHETRAVGYTNVPTTVGGLLRQRRRWWGGGYQLLGKNKDVWGERGDGVLKFVFAHHAWWAFYAVLSVPVFAYQIAYWFPSGQGTLAALSYLFRWFTLAGPVWVLYKIPAGWLSWYNVFGIGAGLVTTVMLVYGVFVFDKRFTWRNAIAVFLYFPYTLLLNACVITGAYHAVRHRDAHFIR